LKDQKEQFVKDELKLKSIEGINGEEIILGSLEETNLSGNLKNVLVLTSYWQKSCLVILLNICTNFKHL
jgi:hypothetical protein